MPRSLLKYLSLSLTGFVLIFLASGLSSIFISHESALKQAESFAHTLNDKTNRATTAIHKLQKDITIAGPKRTQAALKGEFHQNFTKEGISFFVFRNDELILWTDNKISPESARRIATLGTEIHHFDNGWYRLLYFTDGLDEYVASILLSRTFPYRNEYLISGFTNEFAGENLKSIHLNGAPGRIKLKADHQNFYLSFTEDLTQTKLRAIAYAIITLLGGSLVLVGLYLLFGSSLQKIGPTHKFFLLVSITAGLRYFTLMSKWPSMMAQLPAFDPVLYASSTLSPTLADYLINVLLILVLSIMARKYMLESNWKSNGISLGLIFALCAGLIFMQAAWVNQLAKSLVLNSSIPFEIIDLNNLTWSSLFGIMSVGLLYLSTLFVGDGLSIFAKSRGLTFKWSLLIILALTLLWVVITHGLGIRDLAFVLWPSGVMIILLYGRYFTYRSAFKFPEGALLLILFSTIGAHNFNKYLRSREHSERSIIAEKLAINDDPIAEVLFEDLTEELERDRTIRSLFEQEDLHSREKLEDVIVSRYFTGYWSKFDITLHAFTSEKAVWGKLPAKRPKVYNDLAKMLERFGEETMMKEGFHFLFDAPDRVAYLGVIELNYNLRENPDGYLVFEFASTLFPQKIGFPNLLIDREYVNNAEVTQYSSARYSEGRLTQNRGDYPYPSNPDVFTTQSNKGLSYFNLRGFEHYVSRFNESDFVVVSKKLYSPLDKITTATYLCVIFGLVISIIIGLYRLRDSSSFLQLNLNRKIQLLLVLLTLFTMVLFSLATRYYIESNYREKNERLISEKMHSILLELENKLSEEDELNYDMSDYLNRILSQFSVIFFTDINLFNTEGDLIASSQMRMFNEGLISRIMDPTAFAYMDYVDQVEYVQNEAVGELSYISAYSPLLNRRGEIIGYTNLPYFARQTELTNEISSFLVSVINLFVLVFVLSLIIALFISQWITLPLRSIRESLSAIELGKANRLVGYQGRDEIGLLVDEYNAKVSELEINASKLSQSERESAWREMAKQVAHEIKNPLTPMKLSVQHLERTILSEGEVNEERVAKVVKNLVEQIDTLTSIANAFSGFAKMPKAKVERINLVDCVAAAVELFSSFDKVDFETHYDPNLTYAVNCDKDQLVRVFNNLIKNAVQSLPPDRKGQIEIDILKEDAGYSTIISDNGSGITEEQMSKIFVPNFTTKSRGMGLGLAMSKKIVENFSGEISFTSKPGVGSRFKVWIPFAQT
ncbi:MAG: HAMP domain-containing histidine kinase [Flavobacteriales bacterium]|nr:HAMP domain-containing histidine kinase [Flavobacteriales bacterium]